MKHFFLKIIDVLTPIELDVSLLKEISNETYKLIIKLPIFLKFPCIIFIILSNIFLLKNFFKPFYFCNRVERKNLLNNKFFILFGGNLLKIINTYTLLVFYDNQKIQKKINYNLND